MQNPRVNIAGVRRADLSHVNACIAIFEACDEPSAARAYVDLHRLFARGEMVRLCKDALASGSKTTRELAQIVIAAKGLDTGDKVLRFSPDVAGKSGPCGAVSASVGGDAVGRNAHGWGYARVR